MKKKPLDCEIRFDGRLVVITGATAGVGYHTALKYASMGGHILMINRSKEKSDLVKKEIFETYGVPVDYIIADLSLLNEIQQVGNALRQLEQPIDVLIHNAGIHLETRQVTPEGLEVNFVVHYLAPFIITNMVLPKFQKDKKGRIILVGSEAYRFAAWGLDLKDLQWERRNYSGTQAYGAGKMAQLLSMHRIAKELESSGVTITAMHPGTVRTESGKDNRSKFYQWYKKHIIDKNSDSPEVSAKALYYLGVASELQGKTDTFYHLTYEEELTPPALDLVAADELWQITMDLLQEKGVDW